MAVEKENKKKKRRVPEETLVHRPFVHTCREKEIK